ncbi:hypothetical protein BATDEDRAFT_89818 [Batrachochytrium dendrobatidis JAM81]|uniref:Late embryogenesis abundant protein LEA-2 subgroup domain-containing protein n=2 Tax=Batrachochytrium dendrobatidis TaxID=109871 RepID=F4P5B3_BATDJ|nr:uncharacterized protein BATDEDRAFT_89818 [Batrachochytrium dendrobatidis JAM81]EGF79383.1 hypothetical protein BATDEDRAFT_89818 [Batrachochytrium dendrobatidis JAM81]KAJ8323433.1 hypothetical protein O5D80_007750 [Batrachochytrium dendrobatidis]KAK5668139.1 hypothetical protein QVD99_005178 [Batrachochytrium dendrobatidis]OAJ43862.1 hypothetical protein BDEG_27175 [Batrachochytrium dendrobatidis JEL423]|eukprot:XP_006680133.1 hypothetical protein BATDEDRAFT_89818 [Batrachochytrium dendrobatidis JAM81]
MPYRQQQSQYDDEYQQQRDQYDYSYNKKHGNAPNYSSGQQPMNSQYNQPYAGAQNEPSQYARQADSLYGDPFASPAMYSNNGGGYTNQSAPYPSYPEVDDSPAAYNAPPQQSFVAPAMMAQAVTMQRGQYNSEQQPYQYMNGGASKNDYGYNNQMYDPSQLSHRNGNSPSKSFGNQYNAKGSPGNSQTTLLADSNEYYDNPKYDNAKYDDAYKEYPPQGRDEPEPEFSNSFDLSEKKKRHMFCFRSKKSMQICLAVTAAVLLLVGVLGFFFFPRFPALKVLDMQVIPESSHIGPSEDGPGVSVNLQMHMNVSVVNPNRYHLKVESVDLTALLQPNITQLTGVSLGSGAPALAPKSGQTIKIGTGSRATPLIFPPNQNTTFLLNFTLSYATAASLETDIGLGEILQGCGFLRARQRPITINYQATAHIAFLKAFGIKPVFSDDIRINCPSTIGRALANFNLTTFGLDVVVPPQFMNNTAGTPNPAGVGQPRPATASAPATSAARVNTGNTAQGGSRSSSIRRV